jgi:DNA primase
VENQVEEIKQKLDIVNVVSKYVPLKKRGRHFVANCPFHQEKTPSFIVSPELQIFKCFGCGKAGDIFNFVQEYEHIEFKDALEQLASQAGITLTKSAQASHADNLRKRLIEINQYCARFYHYILTSHPLGKSALDYVVSRGITQKTLQLFQVGFSPPNPNLIYNYLRKKGFKDSELISTGTFGQSQYQPHRFYDRFADRLVFPLSDFRGQILGFSGRILPTSTKTNQAKYINSPETDIYHKSRMLFGLNLAKESIRLQNSVLVVEGEFDMISPYQLGVTNVVALKGTAFTQEQLQLLRRYTDTIILGLDSDFAGNAAAAKSIQLAGELGFDLQVLTLGDTYKDPDEAIKSDPQFFRQQLQNTIPVWDFIIQSSLKKSDIDTPRGKREALTGILPFLAKINNSVIRSDYYRLLANLIGSEELAVRQEAVKYEHSAAPTVVLPTPKPSISPPVSTLDSQTAKLEEYFLTLLLSTQKPQIVAQKFASTIEVLSSRLIQTIARRLLESASFTPADFQNSLPSELQPTFATLYLQATTQTLDSRQRSFELKKISGQLLSRIYKEKLKDLSVQIARQEAAGNQADLDRLEKDYNDLLQKLSKIQTQKIQF